MAFLFAGVSRFFMLDVKYLSAILGDDLLSKVFKLSCGSQQQ